MNETQLRIKIANEIEESHNIFFEILFNPDLQMEHGVELSATPAEITAYLKGLKAAALTVRRNIHGR